MLPKLHIAPRVLGQVRIGKILEADPGIWSGADRLSWQWRRNGTDIPGATARSYQPIAADDGAHLTAQVTAEAKGARNAVETPAVLVTREPPKARPLVFDDVFDQGSGPQFVPAAAAFEGDDLTFQVYGEKAAIDPRTGMVEISTDQANHGEDIVVVAQNSGGAAEFLFRVTVEAEEEPAPVTRTDTLVVDGVTITFAQPQLVGNFISGNLGKGDPFVIGPATVTGWTPAPTSTGRHMNGAMLNPPAQTNLSGFDSIHSNQAGGSGMREKYQPDYNVGLSLPVTLRSGDSLVIAVSDPAATGQKGSIEKFVVLTCLDEVPPADAFRPPYSWREGEAADKPLFRYSDIDLHKLPALPLVGNAPDAMAPQGRFHLDFIINFNRDHIQSPGHVSPYGRDLASNGSQRWAFLSGTYAFASKKAVLIEMVQRGIDKFGVFQSSVSQNVMPWTADGGHDLGRKADIVMAGHLLGNDEMRDIVQQTDLYATGDDFASGFQEDEMTTYVTPDIVAMSHSDRWKPAYAERGQEAYQPGMATVPRMPEWHGGKKPESMNAAWVHPYRNSSNHNVQHGAVLALLAMGLQDAWGHDAFFDYHFRELAIKDQEPDPWIRAGGSTPRYDPPERTLRNWENWEAYWYNKWDYEMLKRHKDSLYKYPWQR